MPSAALERHPDTPCAALRGITVSIERTADHLEVVYMLEGEIERLRIPAPGPRRVGERLWQHTCCEIFLARREARGYREINLSPSGEWAAYDFARYREGCIPANAAAAISVVYAAGRLALRAMIPVKDRGLRIGLSAVIEENGGALSGAFSGAFSYWALRHAPGRPDFHHPDAFALELD